MGIIAFIDGPTFGGENAEVEAFLFCQGMAKTERAGYGGPQELSVMNEALVQQQLIIRNADKGSAMNAEFRDRSTELGQRIAAVVAKHGGFSESRYGSYDLK
jgi:hypothetical protein